jgi:hypothetical protein
VLTVWECATRDKSIAQSIGIIINKWIDDDEPVGEIAGRRSSA